MNVTLNGTVVDEMTELKANDRVDDLIAGCILFFVPLLFWLPYIMLLKLFVNDAEFSKSPSFRLMVYLGVCDIVMMLSNMFFGFILICAVDAPLWMNKIVMQTWYCAWSVYLGLVTLLSLNRMVVIGQFKRADYFLFSNFKRLNAVVMFTFVPYIVWLSLITMANTHLIFDLTIYGFNFDFTNMSPNALQILLIVFNIDRANTIINVVLPVVFYLVIYKSLRSQQGNMSHQTAATRQRERTLAIQACMILVTLAVTTIWSNFVMQLGIQVLNGKWSRFSGACCVFSNSLVNPVIYLTMNKKIRRKFMLKYQMKHWTTNVTDMA